MRLLCHIAILLVSVTCIAGYNSHKQSVKTETKIIGTEKERVYEKVNKLFYSSFCINYRLYICIEKYILIFVQE